MALYTVLFIALSPRNLAWPQTDALSHLCHLQSPSPTHVACGLGTGFHSSWGNLKNFFWLVCDLIEVTWLLPSEIE